ncbi:contact-dependent growth inhibition system immunity protein [Nocardiopsis sp. HUAS JQ3]|uniref:contact-dependent growth inhibition system immunity protein n=1 Tax=Nocardiopsis sp. HUAS JQ3 TaxID=3061629 RepID=UPI0023A9E01A|nr:contact-dependent growth inhibition system immunity protein [Nocardiopsis sp. HUAS JQ3]WDZ88849.1 contact-dependent growth inhibition system immunity protein [Nocardiopsis sp. HUAS JQ3]
MPLLLNAPGPVCRWTWDIDMEDGSSNLGRSVHLIPPVVHVMKSMDNRFRNRCYLFNYYLHQDWTIEGETLSEVFEKNKTLHEISQGLRQEAKTLLKEGHDNQCLDDIFFGRWSAGYEPEVEGHEDWNDVLREIVRFSDRYTSD